jgi:hypothetical protein
MKEKHCRKEKKINKKVIWAMKKLSKLVSYQETWFAIIRGVRKHLLTVHIWLSIWELTPALDLTCASFAKRDFQQEEIYQTIEKGIWNKSILGFVFNIYHLGHIVVKPAMNHSIERMCSSNIIKSFIPVI